MAEITVKTADLPRLRLPDVCARTGRPTAGKATIQAVRTPPWVAIGFLFGFIGVVILSAIVSTKVKIVVPHENGRARRRRMAFAGLMFLLLPLMAFVLAVIFEPGPIVAVVLVAVIAGMVWLVRVYRDSLARASFVDEHTIKLAGLHPDFVAALKALALEDQQRAAAARQAQDAPAEAAATPAGWHPDPSGQHAWRWWDGATWTEHVSGTPAAASA